VTAQTIVDHNFSKSRLSSQLLAIVDFLTFSLHSSHSLLRGTGKIPWPEADKKYSGRILVYKAVENCLPSFIILK
jgi:hypothetical protein